MNQEVPELHWHTIEEGILKAKESWNVSLVSLVSLECV